MASSKGQLRWMPLDNAAKIYPAARRKNWSNVFRLSVTLTEPVDERVLQSALSVTARRFPSIAVRLRRGVFWYYLQELKNPPAVSPEYCCPLTPIGKKEIRRCALRVIAYENRIAVEFFHALTDGNGALVFLKSLAAEYLEQKYGIRIPAQQGVLSREAVPDPEELEDSFLRHTAPMGASRRERGAFKPSGTPEEHGFSHVTCFQLSVDQVRAKAREQGVSITGFLAAVMLDALQRLQVQQVADIRRRKPVKVLIPVDLRRLFPSRTLRNFALYTTPEILPRLGHYEFGELCRVVKSNMEANITPKRMRMMITTNVGSEKNLAVRVIPLFIKNMIMKAIFDTVGERQSCLSLSNLGQVTLPDQMAEYVTRLDFVLGVQAMSPYNCGVLSWGDTMYINMIRNIREPALERLFYQVLQEQGLQAEVQSNRKE